MRDSCHGACGTRSLWSGFGLGTGTGTGHGDGDGNGDWPSKGSVEGEDAECQASACGSAGCGVVAAEGAQFLAQFWRVVPMSLAWYRFSTSRSRGGWKPEVLTGAGGVVMRTEEKKRRWGWRPETIGGELQRAGDRTRPAAAPLSPCPPKSQLAATLQQLSAVL